MAATFFSHFAETLVDFFRFWPRLAAHTDLSLMCSRILDFRHVGSPSLEVRFFMLIAFLREFVKNIKFNKIPFMFSVFSFLLLFWFELFGFAFNAPFLMASGKIFTQTEAEMPKN